MQLRLPLSNAPRGRRNTMEVPGEGTAISAACDSSGRSLAQRLHAWAGGEMQAQQHEVYRHRPLPSVEDLQRLCCGNAVKVRCRGFPTVVCRHAVMVVVDIDAAFGCYRCS